MRNIVIIPARFKSTRFPGKPLVKIQGREAILWTLEAARRVRNINEIYVATDDERIKSSVEANGGQVILTSESCKNGTERVAEAAEKIGAQQEDNIINLQGDAPLTPSWFIEGLISAANNIEEFDMITPVLQCDLDSYERFKNDRHNGRVGATTVVFDRSNRALYFSKEVIPFIPSIDTLASSPVFHHVGVYLYRLRALENYKKLPIGPLENAEQLEQVRFLENGMKVFVTEVDAKGREFWELNNPEDVGIIESMMENNPL